MNLKSIRLNGKKKKKIQIQRVTKHRFHFYDILKKQEWKGAKQLGGCQVLGEVLPYCKGEARERSREKASGS